MTPVLVWMDLEMTGLEPSQDVIVEIATLVTDDNLEIVAEGPDLVIHQPDEVLARMDPFVRDMHTRSGLLTAIRESTVSLEEAGAATLAFIKQHVPEPRTVPLCGNSIGTDRRFLAAYLPDIENWLHYRSVDVSSVKELVKRWYPDLTSAHPNKMGSHRALGDIRESVERAALLPPAGLRAGLRAGAPRGLPERRRGDRARRAAARSGARGHQRGVADGARRPEVDAVGVEPVGVRGRVAPPVEDGRRRGGSRTTRWPGSTPPPTTRAPSRS